LKTHHELISKLFSEILSHSSVGIDTLDICRFFTEYRVNEETNLFFMGIDINHILAELEIRTAYNQSSNHGDQHPRSKKELFQEIKNRLKDEEFAVAYWKWINDGNYLAIYFYTSDIQHELLYLVENALLHMGFEEF
jgi:hypothetical protein